MPPQRETKINIITVLALVMLTAVLMVEMPPVLRAAIGVLLVALIVELERHGHEL